MSADPQTTVIAREIIRRHLTISAITITPADLVNGVKAYFGDDLDGETIESWALAVRDELAAATVTGNVTWPGETPTAASPMMLERLAEIDRRYGPGRRRADVGTKTELLRVVHELIEAQRQRFKLDAAAAAAERPRIVPVDPEDVDEDEDEDAPWPLSALTDHLKRQNPDADGRVIREVTRRMAEQLPGVKELDPLHLSLDLSYALTALAVVANELVTEWMSDLDDEEKPDGVAELVDHLAAAANGFDAVSRTF